MKRHIILIFLLILFAVGCGPLKDIRIGKDFGVVVPGKILVHTKPSHDSPSSYVDEVEIFVVEDVQFPEGYTFGDKVTAVLEPGLDPESAKEFGEKYAKKQTTFDVFYKVKFESGREGFINGRVFYPKLSNSIISEGRAQALGTTVQDYVIDAQKGYERARKKDRENYEKQKALIEQVAEDRKKAIDLAPWPDEEKQKVRDRKIWIGMTHTQLILSRQVPGKINESVTADGEFEQWIYKDIVFHLKNKKVIKWETSVEDTFDYIRESN